MMGMINRIMDSELADQFWHLLAFLHHYKHRDRDPMMPMSHFLSSLLYLNQVDSNYFIK